MSAAALARKSGVPKQNISQWLAGVEPKKLSQVKAVASALGTSVDNLCFGEGNIIGEERVTELDALLGDEWISGIFEVRFRRVKQTKK